MFLYSCYIISAYNLSKQNKLCVYLCHIYCRDISYAVSSFKQGSYFTILSGTSKKRRKEEMTGKNVKRPQHELDHYGLVPLPVKVCYTCSRYPSRSTLIWKEMILIFLANHFGTSELLFRAEGLKRSQIALWQT